MYNINYLVLLMIAFLRNVGIFGIDIIELNYVHNYLVVGNLPMDIGIYGLLAFGLNTSYSHQHVSQPV